jgi:hypothetical protein
MINLTDYTALIIEDSADLYSEFEEYFSAVDMRDALSKALAVALDMFGTAGRVAAVWETALFCDEDEENG